MALEMRPPISVKKEYPGDPMIPDISTANGSSSKSATVLKYFRLITITAAIDAEPAFKMVEYWLLAENVSVMWHPKTMPCHL